MVYFKASFMQMYVLLLPINSTYLSLQQWRKNNSPSSVIEFCLIWTFSKARND